MVCAVRARAVAGSGRAEARVFSGFVRIVLNAKSIVRRYFCDRDAAAGIDPVVGDVCVDLGTEIGEGSKSIFRLR